MTPASIGYTGKSKQVWNRGRWRVMVHVCDGSRWHFERRGTAVGLSFFSFSLFLMLIIAFIHSLLPFKLTSLFSFSHSRFYPF